MENLGTESASTGISQEINSYFKHLIEKIEETKEASDFESEDFDLGQFIDDANQDDKETQSEDFDFGAIYRWKDSKLISIQMTKSNLTLRMMKMR